MVTRTQRLGQFTKALEYYQQALQLVRGQASFTEVYVLTDLGLLYEQLGEYPKAAEIFQQAASVCERLAEAASVSNATAMYEALARQAELQQYLGNSYIGMGDYTRAIESLQRNLANTRRYGNRPPRQVLISLANVYIALGDYTKAIDYLEQGLTTVRVEGNKQGELEVLSVLGSARVLLGDATGLEYLQASLPLARQAARRTQPTIQSIHRSC